MEAELAAMRARLASEEAAKKAVQAKLELEEAARAEAEQQVRNAGTATEAVTAAK